VRFANADSLEAYAARSRREVTVVDADAAFEEALFLGLRRNSGIDLIQMREEFGAPRLDACNQAARELVHDGLLRQQGETLMLTQRGRIISNEVFGELLRVVA
jgi:oxygen-independent coproporphyrinogen-3 oxidase